MVLEPGHSHQPDRDRALLETNLLGGTPGDLHGTPVSSPLKESLPSPERRSTSPEGLS